MAKHSYKTSRKALAAVTEAVFEGYKTAVVFEHNGKHKVRATRRGRNEILITVGRLNYRERQLAKHCQRAKCKLPRIWFPGAKAR